MKVDLKPGAMIYPLPVALISCGQNRDEYNIFTTCWMGTISSDPPICYISIKPDRHSHAIIKRNMEFVINLTTEELSEQVDYCGLTTGSEVNKFSDLGLTIDFAKRINAPFIAESPVNIECSVKSIINYGSHDMFISEIVNVKINNELLDKESHRIKLDKLNLMSFNYGKYHGLGKLLGTYGMSMKNKK